MKLFKEKKYRKYFLIPFIFLGIIAVTSSVNCGGGGDGGGGGGTSSDGGGGTYTVGGTVSGLNGTVVLQNNGGDDLTITQNGALTFATALANSSAYNVTVMTQPSVQTCTVANGSGTISGANVTNVAVTCSNNNPDITVTDSAAPDNDLQVLFGSVTQGFSSDETVTITNDGAANLVIGAIASADPLSVFAFSIPTDTCSNQTLAPGVSCTLTVRFSPTASDLGTIGESFDIPSNDPDENPVTVSVSGTATVAQIPPNIAVSPSNIAFGTVATCTTRTRTATISNTGGTSLSITSITTIGDNAFSIQSNTCLASLSAGGSCAVVVEFFPSTSGAKGGTLRILSNDLDTPTSNVGLSGTAVGVCL